MSFKAKKPLGVWIISVILIGYSIYQAITSLNFFLQFDHFPEHFGIILTYTFFSASALPFLYFASGLTLFLLKRISIVLLMVSIIIKAFQSCSFFLELLSLQEKLKSIGSTAPNLIDATIISIEVAPLLVLICILFYAKHINLKFTNNNNIQETNDTTQCQPIGMKFSLAVKEYLQFPIIRLALLNGFFSSILTLFVVSAFFDSSAGPSVLILYFIVIFELILPANLYVIFGFGYHKEFLAEKMCVEKNDTTDKTKIHNPSLLKLFFTPVFHFYKTIPLGAILTVIVAIPFVPIIMILIIFLSGLSENIIIPVITLVSVMFFSFFYPIKVLLFSLLTFYSPKYGMKSIGKICHIMNLNKKLFLVYCLKSVALSFFALFLTSLIFAIFFLSDDGRGNAYDSLAIGILGVAFAISLALITYIELIPITTWNTFKKVIPLQDIKI